MTKDGLTGRTAETSAAVVVTRVLGLIVALAALEHGVGEALQGSVSPDQLMVRSWPDSEALAHLDGEPALTILPTMQLAGIVTIALAATLAVWVVGFAQLRVAGVVLAVLSVLLLLSGGGLFPPAMGLALAVMLGLARVPRRRPVGTLRAALGRRWRALLVATVIAFLVLLPGTALLSMIGVSVDLLVWGVVLAVLLGFTLTVIASLAHDRPAPPSPHSNPA